MAVAVLYARVATKEQLGDEALAQQEHKLRVFAKERGLNVKKVISEKGSGLTCDRPGLNEILKLPPEYDTVLSADISRIGRNTMETIEWCYKLRLAGKDLVCADGSHMQLDDIKQLADGAYKKWLDKQKQQKSN